LSREDFPAPFAPTIAVIRAFGTAAVIPRSTSWGP
jgi:hypothetical protein